MKKKKFSPFHMKMMDIKFACLFLFSFFENNGHHVETRVKYRIRNEILIYDLCEV